MILGLDISTSITGATVLDFDGKLLYNESWDTRNKNKFPTLYDKAQFIKKKLSEEVGAEFAISSIFVEQSLQSFRSGFSSAKTLSTLARFNGIVSWVCYETFNKEPQLISASTARKLVGLKVPRGSKAKEVALEFVLDNVPDFVIQYTKHDNPKPGTYDRSDSYVIAKAGHIQCKKK